MKRQRIFFTFLFVLAFSFCSNKPTDYSINPIKQDQINENVALGKATIMSEEEIINLDIESTSSNVELVYKNLEIQIKSKCSVSCVSNTNNETLNNSLQVKQKENLNIAISGLEPNQEISVWIFSEPTYIGTYQSDDSGNFNLDLLVSESINQGTHTLQLINTEEDESINIPFVVVTEEEVENPGDIKNCTDFNTYAEAKEWFDVYYFDYGDVANLDADGDLKPCESLPGFLSESNDEEANLSSTESTSTSVTTSTSTTTSTSIPDNCYETQLAEYKSDNPELFGQVGASDTGQQVGDTYNGGEVVEISSRSNGRVSFRYRYGESEYNSTIEEWARNSCGIANTSNSSTGSDNTSSPTTTLLPTYSDTTTSNTELGSPTILDVSLTESGSGFIALIKFDLAPAVKDLEIVGHDCRYKAGVSTGGVGGNFGVDSKSCEIEFSANDTEVSFSVAAKYGNYVNCGTDNSSTCVQINNEQYGPYSDWYVVDLSNYESVVATTTTTTTLGPVTTTTLPTISDPTTTNTVLGSPKITSTNLSGSDLTVYFEHAPAVKDLEIVAYGCSYYTVEDGPAGGVDGFEVDQKSCTLNIPTNYPTVYVKAHAKYGNYINCGTDNSSNCVQIDNAQWGPYTDWYSVTVFTPTTTTTTTTTTVPPSSEENTDTSTTSTSTTTTTTTTTTTLPPSNTTTTTTTLPENCYETTRAQFEQDYPELFGSATNWNNDTNSEYQVGDDYRGNGTVVETTPKGGAMYGSLRYRYSESLRAQTLDEWATNTCGG